MKNTTYTREEIDCMVDEIGMLMDDHGWRCEDGHWLTDAELANWTDEMVIEAYERYERSCRRPVLRDEEIPAAPPPEQHGRESLWHAISWWWRTTPS